MSDHIKAPLMLAYGLGVDSTAILVGLQQRGIRPDAILFADTKSEKRETYAYLPVIQDWLRKMDFPPVTVVEYRVKNFKHWPPYRGLGENCLTNGTLPSLAFGFKSCSLKWKVQPQNAWTDEWQPAIDCWAAGGRVRKMIGYDNGAKDRKRYSHAVGVEDPKYDYWYPLIDWGLDREGCKDLIRSAGLPVPPKSACYFCPATQPAELHEHRKEYLRNIVIMEARAKPRLDGCKTQEQLDQEWREREVKWETKTEQDTGLSIRVLNIAERHGNLDILSPVLGTHAAMLQCLAKRPQRRMAGSGTAGLWRSATKTRPAMMTDYIRDHNLLPADEIKILQDRAPQEIVDTIQAFANGEDILNWHDFLEQFSPEDALDELPGGCAGCDAIDRSV
jgi:hypothetical protein